jgi:hypothetical protein
MTHHTIIFDMATPVACMLDFKDDEFDEGPPGYDEAMYQQLMKNRTPEEDAQDKAIFDAFWGGCQAYTPPACEPPDEAMATARTKKELHKTLQEVVRKAMFVMDHQIPDKKNPDKSSIMTKLVLFFMTTLDENSYEHVDTNFIDCIKMIRHHMNDSISIETVDEAMNYLDDKLTTLVFE